MSLEPSDLDHAEAIALLQPFVDGELADAERELVARQIADNPAYQAFVREQQQVRAALRTLARETAPPELRARVIAELDVVAAERERGRLAPILDRARSFGRGAMLMVPAAAAAAVLFFLTSNSPWVAPELGELETPHVDGAMAKGFPRPGTRAEGPTKRSEPAEPSRAEPAEPAPVASDSAPDASLPGGEQLDNLGFAVQVAPARSLPAGVALVTDSATVPGSSAMVRYQVGGGAVVVDRQRRAGVVQLDGARQVFRGHDYYLARDSHGRPRVAFQLAFVQHELLFEDKAPRSDVGVGVDHPDFQVLLSVADALRQTHD
jgi:hypothetical protein